MILGEEKFSHRFAQICTDFCFEVWLLILAHGFSRIGFWVG